MGETPDKPVHIKSAAEILQASDCKELVIFVEPWDSHVKIKALSKGRQQAIRRACSKDGAFDADKFEWALLRYGIVEPSFTDEQFEQLREKSAAAIELLGRAVLHLSGLTKEQQEEYERLFTRAQTSGSSSN